MYARRELRVKVVQTIFAYEQGALESIKQAESHLLRSINEPYKCYLTYLALLPELLHFNNLLIEAENSKFIPAELTEQQTCLSGNSILKLLDTNSFNELLKHNKISWQQDNELVQNLLKKVLGSPNYQKYLKMPKNFDNDKSFIEQIFTDVLFKNELLLDHFEDITIYLKDEEELIEWAVLESLKKSSEDEFKIIPPYQNAAETKEFFLKILHKTILNNEQIESYISKNTHNFTYDRIGLMDRVLMKVCLAEILYCPEIPTNVSFNEYLEISKEFGGTKSRLFINGILDKIIGILKDEDQINKVGRGMM